MDDRDVINAFVAYLRANGHPELEVERRADEENRESADIDSVAGEFAIEHTSVDTLPNQRRDSDWFRRVAGNLEEELEGPSPFRIIITLEYDAIGTGQNWSEIREAIKAWIRYATPLLPEGRSVIEDAHGIPFRLHVMKFSEGHPGIFFARYESADSTLPERIKTAFDRKAKKLVPYQGLDFTTVLLVENDDIALMNGGKMLEAIRAAFPSGAPFGVDQIWYVDTSTAAALEFRDFTSEIG